MAEAQSVGGLVAAYGFNEASGTTTQDASGNGLTGTISGAIRTTAGKFGGAITFDGTTSWVTVNANALLNLTTGMTLEAWVFPTTTTGVRDILIKEGTGADIYNLYAGNGRGLPESNVFVSGSNHTAEGAALPANVWTHVAGTYDGATLRLFINGVEVASTAITGAITTSTGALRIGGNSIWGEYFQGTLDEIRLYNRALTQVELQSDMTTALLDLTPPLRSNGLPAGVLSAGTTQTTLSLTTDEPATCRYSTTPGVTFSAMTNTFSTTGGTLHFTPVSGLIDGGSYSISVRCQDAASNANPDDFPIAFSVALVGGDATPPSVTMTGPADGAVIAGIVTVTADASDNVGVAGVQFLLDGANLGSEDTSAPYSIAWDTSAESPSTHVVSARARDAAGNTTTSTAVSVAVINSPAPENFHDEVVIGSGLTFPTALEFLPDGRMLIAEFTGKVWVVPLGASAIDATPVLQLTNILTENVTAGGERGLVNVVADPDFATNNYIYLFYTAATPQRDRVSRFTMSGNTANPASEFVVWQAVADSISTDHHGGGLAFGPDGKLYVSTGDNGDPPSVQPLSSDHGKILRVNKDGTVPSDNPFFDGNGPNIDTIWARGLRNPYRFSLDPADARMYIGDVGQNSVEELNIGAAGANYGWPTCEGPCGTAGFTNPIFSYSHSGRDAAITGGFVYRGSQFPTSYQGVYFYGDFAQNWIRYLTLSPTGTVTSDNYFLPPDATLDSPFDPVMLKEGPDGSLYYVDIGWAWQTIAENPATIRRVRYITGNQPPVAALSAVPRNGPTPLTVSFSSAGSSDPENQPLTYAWTFGDGGTSTEVDPVHMYTLSGLYNAQLAVSDGINTTLSEVLTVAAGSPPLATITSPANGITFRAGDVINFAGTATDTEDGLLAPAGFTWTILFHHDTHVHPGLGPVSGVTSGTFTIPSVGHDFTGTTSYEIILTVTDSTGLQDTRSVFVYPQKVSLTFVTNPAGLAISLDGVPQATPFVKDALIGFQYTVAAPDQTQGSVNYTFTAWSDGGSQSHTLVVPTAGQSYTANFQSLAPVTAFPTSTTILTGTLNSGTAAALTSVNNIFFAVNSTRTGTRTAAWYGSFTGVSKNLANLRVNYVGNNSRNCAQSIAIFNWTTTAWVQLDSRTVGTTTVAINNLTPTGVLANYVSGTSASGEVRVRIQCQASANFTNWGDLMSIGYDAPTGPPPPDTAPPVLSNGSPTGVLAAGTTQATLSLTTNEAASCRYSLTAGIAYGNMPNPFTTTGGTSHSTLVTGLANGGSYTYYVRCQDVASNPNTNDFPISFSVALPVDTTPPVRSNGQPAGTLPAGTTQTTLSLTTNENATCRYATTPNVAYSAMPNTFTTTGGTSHSTSVTGLSNGGSYTYYVRCQDAADNPNTNDFPISFSVAPTVGTGPVAAYSFNEGSGTNANDASGNGHTGVIAGATWTTSGKFGSALSFDGLNDWVTVNSSPLLNLTTGMTLEAWVFPTTTNGVRDILIKEGAGVDVYNLYSRSKWRGRAESNVYVGGNNFVAEGGGGTAPKANIWTHVASTYDGSILRLFINGAQVASTNITGSITTSTDVLRIGGNSIWGEFFSGRIDEVRLYNRALTQAELQTDMNTPIGP